jgi:hypothetical protein
MRWVLWANEEPPAEVLESLRRFVREGLEPGAGF